MQDIHLYHSKTKQKERFNPIDPEHVKMYVCGPTVYARPHIGNARPRIVFDVLSRFLRHVYPKLTYVGNVTDVDDKINKASQEQNIDIKTLTSTMLKYFHEDMSALNCLPLDLEVKATDHIPEMIHMIQQLIDKGHAYVAKGHVLFSVPSFPEYGRLSHRTLTEQIEGARVEVEDYKHSAQDFVLWKPSQSPDPYWDSPWGQGRPGWHIECTAMIKKHVGLPFDIHGGGIDLLFPHHENEVAQGCAATGCHDYCNFWMHNGLIHVAKEKMSKSIGNVLYVADLLDDAPGEAIRYAVLSTHYRRPLDWSDETLSFAKQACRKLHLALNAFPVQDSKLMMDESLLDALADDLNTPKAFSLIQGWVKSILNGDSQYHHRLVSACHLLGFGDQDLRQWRPKNPKVTVDDIEAQIALRADAKAAKNYQKADEIRASLLEKGIVIEDTTTQTLWYWQ